MTKRKRTLMEKKSELYGYEVFETGKRVAVLKENRAMMIFDKSLFEDSLEGWRIARVLKEVENGSGTH